MQIVSHKFRHYPAKHIFVIYMFTTLNYVCVLYNKLILRASNICQHHLEQDNCYLKKYRHFKLPRRRGIENFAFNLKMQSAFCTNMHTKTKIMFVRAPFNKCDFFPVFLDFTIKILQ